MRTNVRAHYEQESPSVWSFADDAAFFGQAITAYYSMCVLLGITPFPDTPCTVVTSKSWNMLIHSAAGRGGPASCGASATRRSKAVCTIDQEWKADMLYERCDILIEQVIIRGVDDCNGFESAVRNELKGKCDDGVDIVLDSVRKTYFTTGCNMLNTVGRYIVMLSASMMLSGSIRPTGLRAMAQLARISFQYLLRPRLDVLKVIKKSFTLSAFNCSHCCRTVNMYKIRLKI